eukprot:CAMPEP_0203955536 /NCGR_PEP_ID=MMETSP0359-20131031/88142_1 /ASSEMBLY_ACC=CAM_ASM_000338 /TAXON_ID=268821 /ORGANISM="Scrippsiella Hangoei, Strain SHTV-5" /LENGTH=221 /DNA_ID=CAMNT_0050889169 /DNA_START=16 /DNA_END=679 /DNA_ORIENTATION=-
MTSPPAREHLRVLHEGLRCLRDLDGALQVRFGTSCCSSASHDPAAHPHGDASSPSPFEHVQHKAPFPAWALDWHEQAPSSAQLQLYVAAPLSMLAFHHIPSAVVAVFNSFNCASENRSTPSAPTGFDVSAAVEAKFAGGMHSASTPELVQSMCATIRIGASSWFVPMLSRNDFSSVAAASPEALATVPSNMAARSSTAMASIEQCDPGSCSGEGGGLSFAR